MTRGRPQKFKDPSRRMVTASKLTFDILSSLGYDYSDIFEEGRKVVLKKHLMSMYPESVGLFKTSRMDLLIQDIEREIEDLQDTLSLLQKTREAQAKLMTLPEGMREQQIIFSELATKHLTREEITAYHQTFIKRIGQGNSAFAVAKSLLADIQSRANGSGIVIQEIRKDTTPLYQENLVWNYLVEAVKDD